MWEKEKNNRDSLLTEQSSSSSSTTFILTSYNSSQSSSAGPQIEFLQDYIPIKEKFRGPAKNQAPDKLSRDIVKRDEEDEDSPPPKDPFESKSKVGGAKTSNSIIDDNNQEEETGEEIGEYDFIPDEDLPPDTHGPIAYMERVGPHALRALKDAGAFVSEVSASFAKGYSIGDKAVSDKVSSLGNPILNIVTPMTQVRQFAGIAYGAKRAYCSKRVRNAANNLYDGSGKALTMARDPLSKKEKDNTPKVNRRSSTESISALLTEDSLTLPPNTSSSLVSSSTSPSSTSPFQSATLSSSIGMEPVPIPAQNILPISSPSTTSEFSFSSSSSLSSTVTEDLSASITSLMEIPLQPPAKEVSSEQQSNTR
jgi:hypothetical protein